MGTASATQATLMVSATFQSDPPLTVQLLKGFVGTGILFMAKA